MLGGKVRVTKGQGTWFQKKNDEKNLESNKVLFGDKNFDSTFGQTEARIYAVIAIYLPEALS